MGVASRSCSVKASVPVRMARELARLINVISEPIWPGGACVEVVGEVLGQRALAVLDEDDALFDCVQY